MSLAGDPAPDQLLAPISAHKLALESWLFPNQPKRAKEKIISSKAGPRLHARVPRYNSRRLQDPMQLGTDLKTASHNKENMVFVGDWQRIVD